MFFIYPPYRTLDEHKRHSVQAIAAGAPL